METDIIKQAQELVSATLCDSVCKAVDKYIYPLKCIAFTVIIYFVLSLSFTVILILMLIYKSNS